MLTPKREIAIIEHALPADHSKPVNKAGFAQVSKWKFNRE